MSRRPLLPLALVLLFLCMRETARAEDGHDAWLRYAPIARPQLYQDYPSRIVLLDSSLTAQVAAKELQRGLSSMLGRPFTLDAAATPPSGSFISLGLRRAEPKPGGAESFEIVSHAEGGYSTIALNGSTPQAELYAVFHLLEAVASERTLPSADYESPSAPIRWTDEWDNPNGTIERGFAGPSIFFAEGHIRQDLTRAGDYARLLASIGINGCNINNVNADLETLSTPHLKEFARVAEAMRPWGVKLALSIDLTSPQVVGGLKTFDPLDPTVIAWWQAKVDQIYTLIPDFAGFTVKADSEGRPGPSAYGRSPADAANVLARALAPHHGVVLYRGFVYNNHLDWRDPKADRARAGVDNFARYDGAFEPNVILQIKEGPIDFQTREPVSPLLAALPHSNVAIELQTAQEYTGQQRHMVFLPAMWKWVLDTDLHAGGRSTPVREIVTGHSFAPSPDAPRPGGFVSVTNVGMEANWLHHPMAMANLYGFGRLAWNPQTALSDILDSWTKMTWGDDPSVVSTITSLQANSWHVYESYTGPNGMGTLTNITGPHFGPGIESAERNGWGQWFRGEKDGIGMDRTSAGTGYAQQYSPALAAQYESPATTPDDLLLFFHHVPYTYILHSGKTLIQSIYDTHYAGALAAAEYVPKWAALEGRIDAERYRQVLALFTYQAGHAIVWRDAIDTWFHTISGIDDAQGRVGHDPNRIEAEAMTAQGYTPVAITPPETASGGKAVICLEAGGCTLHTTVDRPAGLYDVAVQYFDLRTGVSHYTLLVDGRTVAHWAADALLPPAGGLPRMDGDTSTRYTAHAVPLQPGAVIELRGVPDLTLHEAVPSRLQDPAAIGSAPGAAAERRELAPVDYLELGPNSLITPQ